MDNAGASRGWTNLGNVAQVTCITTPCSSDWPAWRAQQELHFFNNYPTSVIDLKSDFGNTPLYAGYWWDKRLELYHIRHRAYSPLAGRFLQRDPIGYAGGLNLYMYAGNEPYAFVDPMGLYSVSEWGDLGGAFVDGMGDGLAIVADEVTFNQVDALHQYTTQIAYEYSVSTKDEYGDYYEGSRFAADVAREAGIAAGSMGAGGVARGGMAGSGPVPAIITKLAESRTTVQTARYVVAAVSGADVARGGYTTGGGIYQASTGDVSGGVGRIALGLFQASSGFASVSGLKYYTDRGIQGHHAVAKGAGAASDARGIIEGRGLDIDGKWNIINMPHSGSHPKNYYHFVNKEVQAIDKAAGSDNAKFLELFDQRVKEPLRSNPDLLRKCGWGE